MFVLKISPLLQRLLILSVGRCCYIESSSESMLNGNSKSSNKAVDGDHSFVSLREMTSPFKLNGFMN